MNTKCNLITHVAFANDLPSCSSLLRNYSSKENAGGYRHDIRRDIDPDWPMLKKRKRVLGQRCHKPAGVRLCTDDSSHDKHLVGSKIP